MKPQRNRKPSAKALENELSNLTISSSSKKPGVPKANSAAAAPLSNPKAKTALPGTHQPISAPIPSPTPSEEAQEVDIYIYLDMG